MAGPTVADHNTDKMFTVLLLFIIHTTSSCCRFFVFLWITRMKLCSSAWRLPCMAGSPSCWNTSTPLQPPAARTEAWGVVEWAGLQQLFCCAASPTGLEFWANKSKLGKEVVFQTAVACAQPEDTVIVLEINLHFWRRVEKEDVICEVWDTWCCWRKSRESSVVLSVAILFLSKIVLGKYC